MSKQLSRKEVRPSTIVLYDKIYNEIKLKHDINDPITITNSLLENKKDDQYIANVLTAIRYNLNKRNPNTKLIDKYNDLIRYHLHENLKKMDSTISWKGIIEKRDYYVETKKELSSYYRNKALLYILTCQSPRHISDILNIYYLEVQPDKYEVSKNYYIKSTNNLVFNGVNFKLDDKLNNALKEYIEHDKIEDNSKLFKINNSRVGVILNTILNCTITNLRSAFINKAY